MTKSADGRDPDPAGRACRDPSAPLIGPASLLESHDRPTWWSPPGAPRRLEALIGAPNADGTLTIRHYFAGQQRPDNPWLPGDVISTVALGPAALTQRGRPGTPGHELVGYLPEPDGLVEYAWAVNDSALLRWRRIGVVEVWNASEVAGDRPIWDGPEGPDEWGAGTVVATATAATRLKSGWVQALVQVDGSIYHLHRQQRGGRVRWLRHACVRLADAEPFAVASESSAKAAQLSGERDSQPVAGSPALRTLSASESRSGVRGTDLGVRVDHAGRTFLLFGDTHWTRPWLGTRDALAEIADPSAVRPSVSFHGSPTAITGGGVTLREYDVPLDGFSLDGALFTFFTSNHFRDAQVMGRSVLTRAPVLRVSPAARQSPLRFRHLATFSSHRFINVSVQRRGDHLYLWGSGAYRADDRRLARVDLTTPGLADALLAGNAEPFLAAVRYWAGDVAPMPTKDSVVPANAGISPPDHPVSTSSTNEPSTTDSVIPANAGISPPDHPVSTSSTNEPSTTDSVIPANAGISPPDHPISTSSTNEPSTTDSVIPANAGISPPDDQLWSTRESDARPLLTPGAHGEVSVRWVAELGRFLMLTMSGPEDPIGPAVLLRTSRHPWGPWSPRLRLLDWVASGMSFDDPTQRFIRAVADGTDPVGDAIFRGQANATGAAYAPYFYDARLDGRYLVLRYTLSTWNPYQVVLMRHRLLLGTDLPA